MKMASSVQNAINSSMTVEMSAQNSLETCLDDTGNKRLAYAKIVKIDRLCNLFLILGQYRCHLMYALSLYIYKISSRVEKASSSVCDLVKFTRLRT